MRKRNQEPPRGAKIVSYLSTESTWTLNLMSRFGSLQDRAIKEWAEEREYRLIDRQHDNYRGRGHDQRPRAHLPGLEAAVRTCQKIGAWLVYIPILRIRPNRAITRLINEFREQGGKVYALRVRPRDTEPDALDPRGEPYAIDDLGMYLRRRSTVRMKRRRRAAAKRAAQVRAEDLREKLQKLSRPIAEFVALGYKPPDMARALNALQNSSAPCAAASRKITCGSS